MKHDHRSGPLDASALHLLHRAGQCAEVLFTNEAAKADLTPRQFAVLVCVAQNPDVSQTGLVEQTGVDRSTLADVVRRLVKKGLLQRKRTRRDARMYAVRLTAKGQNILSSVKPLASKVDQRILSVLRSDQRGGFIDSLGEIVRAMTRSVRRVGRNRAAVARSDAGTISALLHSTRRRALDDGARIGPLQSLAVGLSRRCRTAAWQ